MEQLQHIHPLLPTAIFAVIGLILIFAIRNAFGAGRKVYVVAPGLFSNAELSFLGVLQQAVGQDFVIFGKVRVADVINVRSGLRQQTWQKAFNAICAKHFDYVLCDRRSAAVVAVIELNDKSHQKRDRRRRDQFLASVCADIGLPMLEFPASNAYSVASTRESIFTALQRTRAKSNA